MENPAAIEVTSLVKDIPLGQSVVHALRGVNVTIPCGEVVAIVGPSGSGKTTLLGLLGGLDVATSGRIVVNGIDITHLSENKLAEIRNRQIGFVFQSFNLIPTLTALENVALPIQFGRGRDPMRRAAELLSTVGLSDRMGHKPSQLSGGEQQRVAIARALANDPAIILADEPTGNLDSTNGERIMQQLLRLRVELGKTVILVTHDPAIAVRTDRTIHLRDGLVVPDAGAEWTQRLESLTSVAAG
jgi:putative ABC transport system ATP-binding protein